MPDYAENYLKCKLFAVYNFSIFTGVQYIFKIPVRWNVLKMKIALFKRFRFCRFYCVKFLFYFISYSKPPKI